MARCLRILPRGSASADLQLFVISGDIRMPFVSHPRLPGKVYVPEIHPGIPQKHPCANCFSCQHCGDDRCQVCRSDGRTEDILSQAKTVKENMVSTSDLYDLIIVGGGPGGFSAGIYAMRAAMKTVLIEKGAPGGQMTLSGEIENYPGVEHIGGPDLAMKFHEHAQAYGLEMRFQEVREIEPGRAYHSVRLEDGTVLNAHAVILATGGSPRKLNIPGEDTYYGKGVSYCAVCDGFFFRNKTVVVIGGGDSAAEESLYLAKLAKHVYLVHRRDTLRASKILQQRIQAECKIDVIWNSIPLEILADENGGVASIALQNVKTNDRQNIATDGVFIFVGFKPNNMLVPAGVRMNADGYVVTDDKCETSIPGLYVIGDLRQKYARQIVIAASDGCTAALAAAHYVENRKAADAENACQLI
jgi:thioredoxin reductase (NADPH)